MRILKRGAVAEVASQKGNEGEYIYMLHVDEAITEYCAQQRMHDCLAAQLRELSALHHRRVAPGSLGSSVVCASGHSRIALFRRTP